MKNDQHGQSTKVQEALNDPTKIPPVDREEFGFLISMGLAIYSGQMPTADPSKYKVAVEVEGDVRVFRLTGNPLNRFALAVREHCDGDHLKLLAVIQRYFAVVRLHDEPRMSQFVKPSPDGSGIMVNDAVFSAAAEEPLTADGCFDPDSFFSKVEAIFKESGDDETP